MKNFITLCGLAVAPSCFALTPLGEHLDIQFTYDRPGDLWTCKARTTETGVDVLLDFKDVYLPLSDKLYNPPTPADSGARIPQPASPAYAFTGIEPGEPLWLAVQGTPGIGEAWPGFQNGQNSGTFGEYFETDTRLPQPQNNARPWIKVMLKSYTYQGTGITPTFSLWTVSNSTPRIWMTTADGIGSGDFYLYSAGSHVHTNFGFGAMGIYRVSLAATAYRGPGQTNPTSESGLHTITFAVGPVARWQATHFNNTELEDPSISGLAADPDSDGMKNLLEYAFGLDPKNGNRAPLASGLGLPVFSTKSEGGSLYQQLDYPRRRAGDLTKPTSYTAEFTDLKSSAWQTATTESVADFTGDQASLNPIWEKVSARRTIPPGQEAAGFGRVRVEQTE